jgi:hypothetical protein
MGPRHAALALLSALLLSPAVAGPAAAGGPTSVLLVVPGEGRTASLYTGQADYETLADLVGAFGGTDSAGGAAGVGDHATGSEVTVTWLIHDVSVWRVDRIYPGSPGGPWIASQTSLDGSGDIWSSPVRWHTASQDTALTGLLTRLGLLGGPVAAQPGAVEPAARAAATPAPTEPAGADARSGPVWGLAGLALGVLLAVAALRAAGRRRPDELDDPERHGVTTRGPTDDVLTSSAPSLRR